MKWMQEKRLLLALLLSCIFHLAFLSYSGQRQFSGGNIAQAGLVVVLQNVSTVEQGQPTSRLAEESSELKQQPERISADADANAAKSDMPPIYESAPLYLPIPLESVYWHRAELDYPPQPLSVLDTTFPQLAHVEGEGLMTFTLLIDESGVVNEVLEESSSLGPEFVYAVRAELEKMHFAPGIKGGEPARAQYRIELKFGYSLW
jgi:hypothetical protein